MCDLVSHEEIHAVRKFGYAVGCFFRATVDDFSDAIGQLLRDIELKPIVVPS